MKFPSFLLALVLGTASAFAEDEKPAPGVSVDLQCVTLLQADALPLIAKFRSSKPQEQAAAATSVAELLAKGTAKLLAWPMLKTRSAERATCEQVEEIRYPTDFSTGEASIYLNDVDGSVTKQPTRVRGADIQPIAKSFDTRNLGFTLEVEPTISGEAIVLAFKINHVALKSIDRWSIEHEFTTEKKAEKIIQEQPRFTTYRVENILSVNDGERKLVGVFKTSDPEPTLELFIIGADIIPTPKGK